MILYLLKSAGCAVVLLLVYRFLLEKEKMHRFNRVYLLLSVLLSFVIPLIQLPFSFTLETIATLDPVIPFTLIDIPQNTGNSTAGAPVTIETSDAALPIAVAIYTIITCVLLTRFAFNIYRLLCLCRSGQVFYQNSVRFVVIEEEISSYTFLNTIFLSRKDRDNLHGEILHHELAHVRQKHSLDIIFIELVRTICWFNPIYIFYKRSIQLNHEFLADEAVIEKCESIPAYQHLLLDRVSLASHLSLGSRFNYSITKKRLLMMTQKTSHARAALKKFFVLPVCITCLLAFGIKKTNAVSAVPETQMVQDTTAKKKTPGMGEQVRSGLPVTLFREVPFTKEGISEKEMDEYKTIQGTYLDKTKTPKLNSIVFYKITTDDQKRLRDLFFRMTREQQTSVNLVFMRSLGPARKNPPTPAQLERWKNPDLYGVWVNDKKINNAELDRYTASDFSYFDASKLRGGAKKNVRYQVQVNAMTNTYYEEYYKKGMQNLKDNPYHISIFWWKKDR